MSKPVIEMHLINKSWGNKKVLKDISFVAHPKDRLVIMGPSGAGKSSLIRCINGLEEYQSGQITIAGEKFWAILPSVKRTIATMPIWTIIANLSCDLTERQCINNPTMSP